MNAAWGWVVVGGLFEAAWASFMKLSNGFTDLFFDVLFLIFMALSMLFLNKGFRAGLPTGPCYAVWVGMGAVISVLIGALVFGDAIALGGWICVAMIVAGVVGLNLSEE